MAQTRSVAALAVALTLASACGSKTPTAPTTTTGPPPAPPSASPEGTWRGVFEYTFCAGSASLCGVSPEAFALRLASNGEGVLQIDNRLWSSAPPPAVDVRSDPATGASTFIGSAPISLIGPVTGGTAQRLDVQLQLTEIGESLRGTVRYTRTTSSGPITKEGRILFAGRDVTAHPARFNGNWVGFVSRTECSGDCTAFDSVLHSGGVTLLIAQAGGTLTGNFNTLEITGTAAGSSMSATGRHAVAPSACHRQFDSGMNCLIEVSFTASADSLDRMRGSITYRVEGVDDRGRPFAYSAAGDLTGLVRWP